MTIDTELFRTLEEDIWRSDPTRRDQLLAADVADFCRFGNVYDREHLLQPTVPSVEVEYPFENFKVEALTHEVVLVTYENVVRRDGKPERARRSSVWVQDGSSWKLRFMQATTLEG